MLIIPSWLFYGAVLWFFHALVFCSNDVFLHKNNLIRQVQVMELGVFQSWPVCCKYSIIWSGAVVLFIIQLAPHSYQCNAMQHLLKCISQCAKSTNSNKHLSPNRFSESACPQKQTLSVILSHFSSQTLNLRLLAPSKSHIHLWLWRTFIHTDRCYQIMSREFEHLCISLCFMSQANAFT